MTYDPNTKRSFDNGVQVAWDGTSLELAQTCLRKYYYSMIRGIRPRDTSVHLVFGGIYASALEQFHKHKAEGTSSEDALRLVVRYALESSWDKTEGRPMIFDHSSKTRFSLIRSIVWYLDQMLDQEPSISTHIFPSGKPAVEVSFAVELTDEILYCGHLDRVIEFGGSEGSPDIWIEDQKTTGSTIGPYFFKNFSPSNQMSGYAYAGAIILATPIKGVMIDAAQIAVNFTAFQRGFTSRTMRQIEEWKASAIYSIEKTQDVSARAAHDFSDDSLWPMNASACGNYGGCPFRSLCATDPRMREGYIKQDFLPHNWDPLKAR